MKTEVELTMDINFDESSGACRLPRRMYQGTSERQEKL